MIRITEWTVAARDMEFKVKPLTVRQRLALSEDLATERARVAAEDARLAGMDKTQTAEHVGDARRKATMSGALLLDAYTLHGAIRILTAAMGGVDQAMAYAERSGPKEMTRVCLEALGIDTDALDAETTSSGNA